jgi:hypothetical protein
MNIREIQLSDAEAFWQMQSALDKETKFMMFEPGERKRNLDLIQRLIQNFSG